MRLGSIFGPGNPFGDMSEDSDDPDPKATELTRRFETEIRRRNKEYLKRAVIEEKEEVYKRDSNTRLLETYALASILAEDLESCYESLSKIEIPNIRHSQSLGLVAYELKRYDESLNHLEGISELSSVTTLTSSLCLLKKGDKNIENHKKKLENILKKSGQANVFLGSLYFNSGDFTEAEKYFMKSVELSYLHFLIFRFKKGYKFFI